MTRAARDRARFNRALRAFRYNLWSRRCPEAPSKLAVRAAWRDGGDDVREWATVWGGGK